MPPAARVGDPTTHGAPLAPGPGSTNVMIGGQPAWRAMIDQHACPAVSISGADGVGSVIKGSPTVFINGLMACRQLDIVVEKPGLAMGPVNPIIMGELTVIIGEMGLGAPLVPLTYPTKPSLASVLSDPSVKSELLRAWNESNPNAPDVMRGSPGSFKQEQGGWIVWNKKTGELEVIRVPAGTRDGLGPIVGTRPADNADQEVVAWFHTHPNKSSEGYGSGPSPGDTGWQSAEGKVPGIIETHDGEKTIPYP
jgi:uncharacterized Zn-binding protein involved in type VI secretion